MIFVTWIPFNQPRQSTNLVGGVSDPALRIFRLAAVGDRKGRPWDLFISRKSTGNFIPEAVALGRKKSYNEENDPRKKFQRRE